jgi:hypothetical protein
MIRINIYIQQQMKNGFTPYAEIIDQEGFKRVRVFEAYKELEKHGGETEFTRSVELSGTAYKVVTYIKL